MRRLHRGRGEEIQCLVCAPQNGIGPLDRHIAGCGAQSGCNGCSRTRGALDADDKDDLGDDVACRNTEKRPGIGNEIEVGLGLLADIALVLNGLNPLDHGDAFRWTCNRLDHGLVLRRIVQDEGAHSRGYTVGAA